MAICNGCGQEARPGASFCGNCGSPLDDQVLSWGYRTPSWLGFTSTTPAGYGGRYGSAPTSERCSSGRVKGVVEGSNVDMGLLSRITSWARPRP